MGRFDEWLDDTRPVTVAPVTGIGDTIGMLMSHVIFLPTSWRG